MGAESTAFSRAAGDMKQLIKRIPILGEVARRAYWRLLALKRRGGPFPGSEKYWEKRYAAGGLSGVGSYGRFSQFKADVINAFVIAHGVHSVIEFGCGDGNQLALARYPQYLGFDVSETAVASCRRRFAGDQSKSFELMHRYQGERADLALSLDVIYHLIEDQVFENYMRTLFTAARRYVVIYSSDTDENRGYHGTHVRHRKFSSWICQTFPDWRLSEHIPNRYPYKGDYREGSFSDFYIHERVSVRGGS